MHKNSTEILHLRLVVLLETSQDRRFSRLRPPAQTLLGSLRQPSSSPPTAKPDANPIYSISLRPQKDIFSSRASPPEDEATCPEEFPHCLPKANFLLTDPGFVHSTAPCVRWSADSNGFINNTKAQYEALQPFDCSRNSYLCQFHDHKSFKKPVGIPRIPIVFRVLNLRI